jgi:hypothetical protein
MKNQVHGLKWTNTVRLAVQGNGSLKSMIYRFGVKLLPFAVKVYGKFNSLPFVAVSPVGEIAQPCTCGL